MSEITLNPDQLKESLKSAIVELLRENQKEVSDFLAEIIEDVGMERAIETDEEGAIAWMNQQLEALGIKI